MQLPVEYPTLSSDLAKVVSLRGKPPGTAVKMNTRNDFSLFTMPDLTAYLPVRKAALLGVQIDSLDKL